MDAGGVPDPAPAQVVPVLRDLTAEEVAQLSWRIAAALPPTRRAMPVSFYYALLGGFWSVIMTIILVLAVLNAHTLLQLWCLIAGPVGLGAGLTYIYWQLNRKTR